MWFVLFSYYRKMTEQNGARKSTVDKKATNGHSAYNLGLEHTDDEYDTCSQLLIVLAHCFVIITFPFLFFFYFKVIRQFERAVCFRLGRLRSGGAQGPGLTFVIPFLDKCKCVDLRLISSQLLPQEILTADSVTVEADATVYFHVINPISSVVNIENARASTKLLAQSTLRNVLGARTLMQILSEREKLSTNIQDTLSSVTESWGVKVERIELKDLRLPKNLQRKMASTAEANQEAQAKLVAAEGECRASESLKNAARVLSEVPAALHLRYLQTMHSISTDSNSTILFPMSMETLNPLKFTSLPPIVTSIPMASQNPTSEIDLSQQTQEPQPELPPISNTPQRTATPSTYTSSQTLPMPISTTVTSANIYGTRYPQQNTNAIQRFGSQRIGSVGTITEMCTSDDDEKKYR
ncbi:Stomatin-2-like protein [Aphelenchoides besseyi]|nr:Stomatin-2-like protein [Aphelenchoides besseyi]